MFSIVKIAAKCAQLDKAGSFDEGFQQASLVQNF